MSRPKWSFVDEDEGERIYRACPFCRRRLIWKYDNERDFTIGVPRCHAHGELDTWVVTDGEHHYGAGRLMDSGILLDIPVPAFDAPFDSHRFKAVSPKRKLKNRGGSLLERMVTDGNVH